MPESRQYGSAVADEVTPWPGRSAGVTPAQVHARIARGHPIDFIDVRTTSEWNSGHAVGAQHVPLSRLDPLAVVGRRQGRPNDPICVISAADDRSAAACDVFLRAGFPQALRVEGGIGAWTQAGLPMQFHKPSPSLGFLKQAGILLVVAIAVIFVIPGSPISIWGSAFNLETPAGVRATAGVTPQPTEDEIFFEREVVSASAAAAVLVEYHAGWSTPSQLLAAEIEALRRERGDRLRVVRIDIDDHAAFARDQGVTGVPDIRLWVRGSEAARFTGYRREADIADWVGQFTPAR